MDTLPLRCPQTLPSKASLAEAAAATSKLELPLPNFLAEISHDDFFHR